MEFFRYDAKKKALKPAEAFLTTKLSSGSVP